MCNYQLKDSCWNQIYTYNQLQCVEETHPTNAASLNQEGLRSPQEEHQFQYHSKNTLPAETGVRLCSSVSPEISTDMLVGSQSQH